MERAPKVIEAVKMSEGYLQKHGVESPRLSAEHLLAKALGCTRLDLYLRFEETLADPVLGTYRSDLKKRAGRMPLQYIIGSAAFRSHDFKVTADVFIPRPETELLVDLAVELMAGLPAVRFIEFGTGSGAISGSLAAENPGWSGVAFDISPTAAGIASSNIDALGLAGRVEVLVSDGFGGFAGSGEFDLVVSNPPYIRSADIGSLQAEVSEWESRAALDGGEDGLAFYPAIAEEGFRLLRPGGAIALEIGDGQGAAVKALLDRAGFAETGIRKDYNGLERMAAGRRPGGNGED
jgi:release factor glutamine methyltransferase